MLPDHWPRHSDWTEKVGSFFSSENAEKLFAFVDQRRAHGDVFPATEDVFAAFELTSFVDTKVVILGQDPYHGPNQAHGLSFSVREGVKVPPSLKNIYKELVSEYSMEMPDHGNLESWAHQGTLLLNTVLTVDAGNAGSHRKQGWEIFTDLVISALNEHPERIVFLLWGKPAEKKAELINDRHECIISPHPSPLSAHRGFLGSKPFSRANNALRSWSREEIDWLSICRSTSV